MDKESKELQALHAQQRAQQAWIQPESSNGCFIALLYITPAMLLLLLSYWIWPLTIAFLIALLVRYRLQGSGRESLIIGIVLYLILLLLQLFVFKD